MLKVNNKDTRMMLIGWFRCLNCLLTSFEHILLTDVVSEWLISCIKVLTLYLYSHTEVQTIKFLECSVFSHWWTWLLLSNLVLIKNCIFSCFKNRFWNSDSLPITNTVKLSFQRKLLVFTHSQQRCT